jgi:hypothetical protein
MICTVSLTHERVAKLLAPLIHPSHLVVFNPGSTCGSLHVAKIWRELGVKVCGADVLCARICVASCRLGESMHMRPICPALDHR